MEEKVIFLPKNIVLNVGRLRLPNCTISIGVDLVKEWFVNILLHRPAKAKARAQQQVSNGKSVHFPGINRRKSKNKNIQKADSEKCFRLMVHFLENESAFPFHFYVQFFIRYFCVRFLYLVFLHPVFLHLVFFQCILSIFVFLLVSCDGIRTRCFWIWEGSPLITVALLFHHAKLALTSSAKFFSIIPPVSFPSKEKYFDRLDLTPCQLLITDVRTGRCKVPCSCQETNLRSEWNIENSCMKLLLAKICVIVGVLALMRALFITLRFCSLRAKSPFHSCTWKQW